MNNIFSISSTHQLAINNLNATSTTIFTNLNSLSTNSTLSINNLNNLSTQSYLDIPNIKTTSTTTLSNLNSLSSNTLLSINGASTVLSTLNVSGNTIINNTLNLSNQISGGNQLRISGSPTNDGITNALSIGGYGMVGIDSPGIQYGRLKLDNSGNITCSGSITNGSGSYMYAGGLRLGGFDTNTLYNTGKTLGITCDNGYNITFNIWGGTNGVSGNMMNINNTGITCNSTLYTRLNQNSLVSYMQPNPQNGINNTTSMTNLPCINLCAGAYTTGNAIEPYLTVYFARAARRVSSTPACLVKLVH